MKGALYYISIFFYWVFSSFWIFDFWFFSPLKFWSFSFYFFPLIASRVPAPVWYSRDVFADFAPASILQILFSFLLYRKGWRVAGTQGWLFFGTYADALGTYLLFVFDVQTHPCWASIHRQSLEFDFESFFIDSIYKGARRCCVSSMRSFKVVK